MFDDLQTELAVYERVPSDSVATTALTTGGIKRSSDTLSVRGPGQCMIQQKMGKGGRTSKVLGQFQPLAGADLTGFDMWLNNGLFHVSPFGYFSRHLLVSPSSLLNSEHRR